MHKYSLEDMDPKDYYWITTTCELCGSRVRGNKIIRHFQNRPTPTLNDAVIMVTQSGGYRKIKNLRAGLLASFDEMPPHMRRRVYELFREIYEHAYKVRMWAMSEKSRFIVA